MINYVYLETMWETDTTVVIYSWKYRAVMSCASHLLSHSTYWWLYSEQRVEILLLYTVVSSIKSPIFLSWVWCLTSPWLRKSFSIYVPLITLYASTPSCWSVSLSRSKIFWFMKRSLESGCWAVENSVPTNLFWAVHSVFKLVLWVEDQTLIQ